MPAFFFIRKIVISESEIRGFVKDNKKDKQPVITSHSVDKKSVEKFKQRKKRLLTDAEYFSGLRSGDSVVLGQAITLIESLNPKHRQTASSLLERCMPYDGGAVRIGITGVPGVGKSTFIEKFGLYLISQGKKVAVLAVDPTSTKSGGSILGDKTRMEKLAIHPYAFIRPSPSGNSLGGVARKTRETILLCETAGFDVIIVETVGVGQSEVAVHSMVDFFLLLMLAGAGDEMQGIKRGIIEMADLIAITKADGSNLEPARRAEKEYRSALHLYPLPESGWTPEVTSCSALENTGIDRIWKIIGNYLKFTQKNGYFEILRKEQALYWFHQALREELMNLFFRNEDLRKEIKNLEQKIQNHETEPFTAVNHILKKYFENQG